ncbi:MAG: aminotransferase class V-fold PLP-dependent enzyme [SAR202 cluster bacterium]|nr:aminotransferase class V-fold PLP-dependent enzyme [SAR202 cluster bacterium]
MDIEGLRRQIPTVQKMAYFNTGWEGPSPVPVIEAIKERLEYESYNGPSSPEVLESAESIARQAKEAVAKLVNASPDEIALTENTTEGLNVVLNGLPWMAGDEIVTCNLEHPSVLLPSYNLQQRAGVKVKVVILSSNSTHDEIVSKFEEALTPKTRMVFLSHIEYSCGLRMPIKRIRRLTQGRGIWMLLDGAQGPGHVRLDMRDIGCDFYSMPGHKWLLGPDGTGALYIRKEMLEQVRPVRVGYRFAKSFDQAGNFVPLTDSIDKFRVSTTSAPLRAGHLEAVRFHQRIGSDTVEQRSLAQAARLKTALSAIPGVRVTSPLEGPECTGLVTFTIEGVAPADAVAAMWKTQRILTRAVAFPSGIRASVAFFNTDDEIARLAEAVRGLAKAPKPRA